MLKGLLGDWWPYSAAWTVSVMIPTHHLYVPRHRNLLSSVLMTRYMVCCSRPAAHHPPNVLRDRWVELVSIFTLIKHSLYSFPKGHRKKRVSTGTRSRAGPGGPASAGWGAGAGSGRQGARCRRADRAAAPRRDRGGGTRWGPLWAPLWAPLGAALGAPALPCETAPSAPPAQAGRRGRAAGGYPDLPWGKRLWRRQRWGSSGGERNVRAPGLPARPWGTESIPMYCCKRASLLA